MSKLPFTYREFVLQEALERAANTIEFLHGCLTNDMYRYEHPEQTEQMLEEIEALIGERGYCLHSNFDPECSSCREHSERLFLKKRLKNEALEE